MQACALWCKTATAAARDACDTATGSDCSCRCNGRHTFFFVICAEHSRSPKPPLRPFYTLHDASISNLVCCRALQPTVCASELRSENPSRPSVWRDATPRPRVSSRHCPKAARARATQRSPRLVTYPRAHGRSSRRGSRASKVLIAAPGHFRQCAPPVLRNRANDLTSWAARRQTVSARGFAPCACTAGPQPPLSDRGPKP